TITVTQDITYTATFEDEVGITELETSAVAVYPNPATDNIIISLRENITEAVFTLYDMQGRVLIRRNITNEEVISVNEFAAGIYIYNVSAAKEHYQGKIVISE
ncbi:MAG: T9SS type A sorting domain-containing protein, partial [Bacteroidales bacterium]|nr:T9SS type A sorting domain-containing protein [Bacteroidales bacterium]